MSRSEKVSSPLTVNKNSSFRWVAVVVALHRDNMADQFKLKKSTNRHSVQKWLHTMLPVPGLNVCVLGSFRVIASTATKQYVIFSVSFHRYHVYPNPQVGRSRFRCQRPVAGFGPSAVTQLRYCELRHSFYPPHLGLRSQTTSKHSGIYLV